MHRTGSSEPFSALMRCKAANALRLAPAWLAMAAASSCRPAGTAGDSPVPETLTRPTEVQPGEPLPSWKAGPQKQAIIDFVTRVTEDRTTSYVPPGERIAVFDNDGTLWSEQPMYVQLAFALARVKELAPKHPDWREQQPFKGVLEGDAQAVAASGERGLVELMAATHLGNTTDEFAAIVTRWIDSARHPRFDRPYTEVVYQPMLELIGYLREHDFKVFIVSGGGVEFMRPWVERVYGVPRERVVGSRAKVKYEVQGGVPVLQRLREIDLVDDKAGKPVGIHELVGQRPILVIFGDDIGMWNLSCYSGGVMGYRTPHIDRLAAEGMRFTDAYGEQSCTAGRASFITGQSGFRTGLTKVGMPAAPVGLQAADPTIAELLKPLGYATGQFGKNHFGDLNKFLPTAHGFDEFFGNLYHLNAEEDPEDPDYPDPKDFPKFKEQFGPRGVVHCWAADHDDPTEQPRWGKVGKQKIEDTGPLTTKRMETCDDEFVAAAKDWIRRQHAAGKPWFCWLNTTHMHFRTHTKESSVGQAGRWQSPYHDTMIDHDKHVGEMLNLLDTLGLNENTIVLYTTDNGPHMNSWPDGAMTPFRSEKNTNWEGAFRVPLVVRWPGKIPAGTISNEIIAHHDWLPTFLAAAGEPDIKEKLLKGHSAASKTFKVHLDGVNLLPHLTGKEQKSPRQGFFYFNDDGDLVALRFDNWKMVFMEQRCTGTLQVWAEPFVPLRLPKLFNLRTDPFERADTTSNTYWDWFMRKGYLVMAAQGLVGKFLETFKAFPPRQKAASFTVDQAMAKLEAGLSGAQH